MIHHAAHRSATVDDIHRWHLQNGWSGFGYHFYITKEGKIYRGRSEGVMGSHAKGYNNVSLGICLQGNFDIENPSKNQLEILSELLKHLCDKYCISTIKGHRELKSTSCPGQNFPLTEVKNTVFSILGSDRSLDTYTVKAGDTLWSVSKSFNITNDELMKLNGLKDSLIYKGQVLRVM